MCSVHSPAGVKHMCYLYTSVLQVVFFGDNVPPHRVKQAADIAATCDAVLVVGSSLMVLSAFRLVK